MILFRFVEDSEPFDLVVDGLNVFYGLGSLNAVERLHKVHIAFNFPIKNSIPWQKNIISSLGFRPVRELEAAP